MVHSLSGLDQGDRAAVPTDLIWRLTVAQYHAMIATGILTDDDPVELIDGWLVLRMPRSLRHRAVTRFVREALATLLPQGWYVDSQEPITLETSEPEPDVMIVRGRSQDYLDRHPGASDVALVVEVADTTLQRDRTVKRPIYAQVGIPIYWIVNLSMQQVEAYQHPNQDIQNPDYLQRVDYTQADQIPVLLGETTLGTIAVQAILP